MRAVEAPAVEALAVDSHAVEAHAVEARSQGQRVLLSREEKKRKHVLQKENQYVFTF